MQRDVGRVRRSPPPTKEWSGPVSHSQKLTPHVTDIDFPKGYDPTKAAAIREVIQDESSMKRRALEGHRPGESNAPSHPVRICQPVCVIQQIVTRG
jgi:hypothetical protein